MDEVFDNMIEQESQNFLQFCILNGFNTEKEDELKKAFGEYYNSKMLHYLRENSNSEDDFN